MPLPATLRALRWWGHQTWLPRGVRYRALRRLANPDRMRGGFQCPFAGLTYGGDLSSYIDWNIYFLGAYEPEVLAFLADAARERGAGAVFLDVGANVGQHTLFMAGRTAQVVAFEPWAVARARLEANVAANGLSNVAVRPVALGEETRTLPFFAPAGCNLGTGSFVADVNHNKEEGALPVVAGDEAVAGLARVDIVKIDTEGFEAKVLRGLGETLARHRPIVLFELTPPVAAELGDLKAGLAELFGPGWRFHRLEIRGEGYRLAPLAFTGGQAIAVALPEGSRLG